MRHETFSDQWLDALLQEGQHSIIGEMSLSMCVPVVERHEFAKRRGKYNATKKEVDGIVFDSTGEANRYSELKYQAAMGIISHKEQWLQVPFELYPADDKQRAITYKVDFLYTCNGVTVAEDFKGFETPVFRLKAKLFRAQYRDMVLWINRDKAAVYEA